MEEDELEVPFISAELIRYLDRVVPIFVPTLDTLDRKIWIEVGKRQLLETLREAHEEQHTT